MVCLVILSEIGLIALVGFRPVTLDNIDRFCFHVQIVHSFYNVTKIRWPNPAFQDCKKKHQS